jgi:DNA-binding transcriptional MocR family regulator
MDDEGLIPEAFEETCQRVAPKLLCCTPTLQNPTTRTWSLSRRREILEIALRYNVTVIEDDAYGALPITTPPPLAALAPEQVFHVAGLSKPLSPALRISYLVIPPDRSAARLSSAIRASAAMASPLNAAIARRWIELGIANEVLTAIRAETKARQHLATQILPQTLTHADPSGFHIWLDLPKSWTRSEFTHHLHSIGISVVGSEAFAVGPLPPPEAVRIGLGAASDISVLKRSLTIVAELLSQTPADMTLVV